jgi:Domain of unknown function (DUF4760)
MDWHDGWEMIGALTTVGLFAVAWYQIRAIRNESRVERTLAVCSRYESDATVERCVRTLRNALATGGDYKADPCKYQHETIMVLNFLDTLAIGIDQGVYDDRLARDHMEAIVRKWMEVLLEPTKAKELNIPTNDYKCLNGLWSRWNQNKMYYGKGLTRRLRSHAR